MKIEKIGVIGRSSMENESRFPIHMSHLESFSDDEINHLVFETDYPGSELVDKKLNLSSREEIFKVADLVIIPKPTSVDYELFRQNQIIWGWLHCVQGINVTQVGIDKKLTYCTFESMYAWNGENRKEHIFARNNELAGYASVIHALSWLGMTAGSYGQEKKIAILGFGSSGKGSTHALLGLGCSDITVFSKRSKFQIADAINNVKYGCYVTSGKNVYIENKPAVETLKNYDVIINCVLQNPNDPINFINSKDILSLRKNTLIIDVSCDKGMGFEFAEPTSFEKPMLKFGDIYYYSVDHSPSYFWNSASYEISGSLIPFVKKIIHTGTIECCPELKNAIEIKEGEVVNGNILEFQKRDKEYPYKRND